MTEARADGDCYRIEAMPEVPTDSIHPKSALAWRKWLERHHARGHGVWLITYKQATGKPRIAYDDAVATALCFGWIDSKPRALQRVPYAPIGYRCLDHWLEFVGLTDAGS